MILSICIPTYNRAELLQSALLSIAPQVKEFEDEVELIVSDNNSTPATYDVVQWAGQFCKIRYNHNPENIGSANNYVLLTTVLAKGEFVWLLGDDDFIRPGAVKKILEIIKRYPEVQYIYVNYASFSTKQLSAYQQPISAKELPNELPLGNNDGREYYVEKWETLLDPNISEVFLGGIQMAVVRRNVWVAHKSHLRIGEPFTNLASTYPQIILFAKSLIGRPAYYIGTPYVVVIDGAREWLVKVPKICLVYLHEALDCYEIHGVDSERIEKCRRYLVKNNCHFILEMIRRNDMDGISREFMMKYIAKYWKYIGAACVERMLK